MSGHSSTLHLQEVPPSCDVHSLTQALLSAEEDDLKQSSGNTALKEEHKKLLNENKWLQSKLGRTLHMAKQEIQRLEEALKARRAGQDACEQREETVRENEKEISALQESLHAKKQKTERVQAIWTKASEMSAVFENDLQKELALKKKKRQHFWDKKRQKHSSEDEEGAVSSAQTGQEVERSHSDREVEEEGARPVQAGQH